MSIFKKKKEEKTWSIYNSNNELIEQLTEDDFEINYTSISGGLGNIKSFNYAKNSPSEIREYVISFDDLSKCKKITDKYCKIVAAFKVPFIRLYKSDDWYFIEDGEKQLEEVLKEHKPFVIKGSDWPYYFNVNGSIVESETSNYWLFLKLKYDYLDEHLLEEYTGKDKYFEHKN